MGKVKVYIATSLDGFIARPDDDISWLDPFSGGNEDYGYGEFIQNIGTAVMGARTYEQSLAHPERLLKGLKNYIVTHRSLPRASGTRTELWHGELGRLIRKIQVESKQDIFIVGGGKLISRTLNDGLVDEIHQFIVPVLLGEGIPLYTGLQREVYLTLKKTLPYGSGIVKMLYVPGPARA